ncbi:hypothetical protein TNCT_276191 [Trichonephila clavata]|uniref:Uncharacterized protein n=1 Tax=Trichonephila clavata TaxID=2740835 RepID=A0A8X6K923_TRICU|nr:hypothetical protein TNCT_276191 [Trichonephila clavata]
MCIIFFQGELSLIKPPEVIEIKKDWQIRRELKYVDRDGYPPFIRPPARETDPPRPDVIIHEQEIKFFQSPEPPEGYVPKWTFSNSSKERKRINALVERDRRESEEKIRLVTERARAEERALRPLLTQESDLTYNENLPICASTPLDTPGVSKIHSDRDARAMARCLHLAERERAFVRRMMPREQSSEEEYRTDSE